jgi:mannose-6-phosphate isomerase-like protein (cupin superfamily)
MTKQPSTQTDEIVSAWRQFLKTADWRKLIAGIEPKATGCGPVYEVSSPLERPSESLAIADMRQIPFATPHYHTNGEVEMYFVLEGSGLVVVGGKELSLQKDGFAVIPPETAHYVFPAKDEGLVLAVVNTPPFNPDNNIDLTQSNPAVAYDHQQFLRLTKQG